MVLTDEERKARQKESHQKYRSKPENKAKAKEYASKPEVKARQKTSEAKAKRKKYLSRPEVKARVKDLEQTPERKAKAKEYNSKPERKAKRKEYASKPENKAKATTYRAKPENKAKAKEYASKPEVKAKKNNTRNDIHLNILQVYSKRLSNSDIPCCNCCGLNSHLDFLAIDHIAGKRQMDSEPELVKLGYSSKLKSVDLQPWIKKNNFPDGFQILCHNCNQAKGYYGKCPHQK